MRAGFLGAVLDPLLEQRTTLKTRSAETDDDETAERLDKRSNALKWILVSCFGYQGYRNSKFGCIECHEAINAYARDILLTAKEIFEANGWEVVHGIVDSIWVKRRPGVESAPIEKLTAAVTEAVDIALEFEGEYEWVCFVPMRNSEAGALTKYFGKFDSSEAFKVRGIELRQRSTPAFIEDAQEAFMDALDAERTPEAICDVLQTRLHQLHQGTVSPEELVIRKRASKPLGAYTQRTQTVAALQRAADHDVPKNPGQDVRYVVVDDAASRTRERVRLSFEPVESYDADFYEELLVRAAESITSPLGWDRQRIRRYLSDRVNSTLSAYQ